MRGRGLTLLVSTAVAFALVTSTALGAFHLMKVREVSAGPDADQGYVELQMLSSGQNFVSGHDVTTHASTGAVVDTVTMADNVAFGESQRTVLVAEPDFVGDVDFPDANLNLSGLIAAGAVCFPDASPPDCVAWGGDSFTGAAVLPDPGIVPFAGTLPTDGALHRDISGGCATLLEAGDDTGTAADFFSAQADPTPNATEPLEAACPRPNTTITKKPPKRTTKRKGRFAFSSSIEPATFRCSVDSSAFKACSSPLRTKRLKPGRHRFRVKARAGGLEDLSPASYRWRIKKRR